MIPARTPSAEPRTPYRVAFLGAVVLAFAGLFIYANRDFIEAALGQPTAVFRSAPAAPPCLLEREGQVAHITVRLAAGELVAQCRIVQGRKS